MLGTIKLFDISKLVRVSDNFELTIELKLLRFSCIHILLSVLGQFQKAMTQKNSRLCTSHMAVSYACPRGHMKLIQNLRPYLRPDINQNTLFKGCKK